MIDDDSGDEGNDELMSDQTTVLSLHDQQADEVFRKVTRTPERG